MVRQALCDRGRHSQYFMNTAEIEVRDKQADRRKMVINSLAEPIRQSREAARGHAERQVFPLGIAC